MAFPKLAARNTSREFIDVFNGYVHKLKIKDGEFYETKNLSTYKYPLFSTRPLRGTGGAIAIDEYDATLTYGNDDYVTHEGKLYNCNVATGIETPEAWTAAHWQEVSNVTFTNLQAIIAKDKLYWVDNYYLYANGRLAWDEQLWDSRDEGKRVQLVSMGAYICVFPGKKYYNTMDPSDCGSMEAEWGGELIEEDVEFKMCHQDGTVYTNVTYSGTEPASPANGDFWMDTGRNVAQEYSAASGSWVTLETTYVRVNLGHSYGRIPSLFKEYDGVTISGLDDEALDGEKIIYALGGNAAGDGQAAVKDWFVIVGSTQTQTYHSDGLSIKRSVPDMDYVCEAQNRLWGCKYGLVDGKNVNEIYCCALGDFRNWSQFLGVSTDSWRATRGSDGEFTGCINYMGTPTFFKESMIHPVSISSTGAHQVTDIPARGVQKGSWKSLSVVNETLYYKSRSGIMAYQGGMPTDVSDALGGEKYYNAVAGTFDQNYYISMQDANEAWQLFCYDAARGLWMHEDNLHVDDFAALEDELYVKVGNHIYALNGTEGTLEDPVDWRAETGILPYRYPDKKYVYRYDLSMYMEKQAKVKLFIEYDSSGTWTFMGDVELGTQEITGSKVIPVRPRRCDHLRILLLGKGDVKIYSITRILEKGSDV